MSGPRVVALLQARMTSARLPGKVLADVGGQPLLELMVSRLERASAVDTICIATSINEADDPVAELAGRMGHSAYRGSELDVLARMAGAAAAAAADVVVRVTGDCPMIDPAIVDACVLAYLVGDVDYCSNTVARTFPRGLDNEVLSAELLRSMDEKCREHPEREHVTLHAYEVPGRFRVRVVRATARLHRPSYRWTVDTAADLELVRAVVAELGPCFTAAEAVALCDRRPDIVNLNAHVEQKAVR